MDVHIIVIRQPDNGKQTLGDMQIFGSTSTPIFECKTIELPWKNNQRSISCFPKGVYDCEKVGATASIPYPHIWIKEVEGRDGIKIHRVNYVRQLRGCIGVGEKHIDIDGDGEKDVTNSTKTLDKLLSILPNKPFGY